MLSHCYPEEFIGSLGANDFSRHLDIVVSIIANFGRAAGKNLFDYETTVLKAKLGYGKAIIMRKKKDEQSSSGGSEKRVVRSSTARWINAPLSDEHVAAIEGAEVTLEDIGARLLNMAILGWDITIKRDDKTDGYSCFGFADDPHSDDGRVGLSGWASNPTDAALVFVYKYFDVLGGLIPIGEGTGKRRFR